MGVEEELKRKRADLLGEVEELVLRIETIRKQVSAIDHVIAIYDSAHAYGREISHPVSHLAKTWWHLLPNAVIKRQEKSGKAVQRNAPPR